MVGSSYICLRLYEVRALQGVIANVSLLSRLLSTSSYDLQGNNITQLKKYEQVRSGIKLSFPVLKICIVLINR